jgi:hypothetical protein
MVGDEARASTPVLACESQGRRCSPAEWGLISAVVPGIRAQETGGRGARAAVGWPRAGVRPSARSSRPLGVPWGPLPSRHVTPGSAFLGPVPGRAASARARERCFELLTSERRPLLDMDHLTGSGCLLDRHDHLRVFNPSLPVISALPARE